MERIHDAPPEYLIAACEELRESFPQDAPFLDAAAAPEVVRSRIVSFYEQRFDDTFVHLTLPQLQKKILESNCTLAVYVFDTKVKALAGIKRYLFTFSTIPLGDCPI
eukprot:tig00020848_g14550.t1